MAHIIKNIHSRNSGDGGGGSHTHSINPPRPQDNLLMADIAFTLTGHKLDVVKSRYGNRGINISVEKAVKIFSDILSVMTFKENDLRMFQEGLSKQIEEAIKIAIQTFHEGR